MNADHRAVVHTALDLAQRLARESEPSQGLRDLTLEAIQSARASLDPPRVPDEAARASLIGYLDQAIAGEGSRLGLALIVFERVVALGKDRFPEGVYSSLYLMLGEGDAEDRADHLGFVRRLLAARLPAQHPAVFAPTPVITVDTRESDLDQALIRKLQELAERKGLDLISTRSSG